MAIDEGGIRAEDLSLTNPDGYNLAAAGAVVMGDIEAEYEVDYDYCSYWAEDHCSLVQQMPDQKIKLCVKCPSWRILTLDNIYEDINSTHVIQTYDWWRGEFVRTGRIYAKDRMIDFVRIEDNPPINTLAEPAVKPTEYVTILQLVLFGMVLGIVLGIAIQTIVSTWVF